MEISECECKSGSYCFNLVCEGRVHVMCAPESKIQMAWIEDLIACGVTFKEEDLAVTATSIFEFTAKDIDDNLVDLSKFAGNVLIVVNVASF